MSIIKTHNITLYGGNEIYKIVLRPLSDEHLPLLYKWNADSEVLYWTEGGDDIIRSYDEHVDILHCFSEDYNKRSQRMWEKHGFTRIMAEPLSQPQKGQWQYHYRLTRQEFIERR